MFRLTLSVLTLAGLLFASTTDARADDYDIAVVQANASNYYTYDCYQGGSVGVAIAGDGDTDLDLIITDCYGNIVASNVNYSDNCAVQFYANSGMTYSIEIRNLGSVWNQYEFAVAN